MNTVTLIGALTRDPELRKRGESKVCDLRVAEANGRKESPLFVNVSVFGRQAEICNEYLSKGRQVAITGQLRFREWKNDEGQKRSEHTIAADRIDFLTSSGKRRNSDGGSKGSKGKGKS